MRKCVSCAELIDVDAKVCKYCKSPQSILRHLSFGTTTLALMTAFVSVSTAAVPIIKSTFTPDDSNIRLVFQGTDPDDHSILLLAYNSGTKPGGLGRSVLKYRSNNPKYIIRLQHELTTVSKDPDSSLIQEGDGRQLRLKLANTLNHSKFVGVSSADLSCLFEFQTAEFVGPPKILTVEQDCEEIYGDPDGAEPGAPVGSLVSPETWSISPDETKEDDMDVPSGGGFSPSTLE